jgi:hypothetical protein
MSEENEILNQENASPQENTADAQKKQKRKLREFIDGTVFTREVILGQLPFVLFLMGLALIYIANRYHAENVIRRINQVQNEIKDLRSEHISVTSELMMLSKQSEVKRVSDEKGLGLVEATEPPKIILTESL